MFAFKFNYKESKFDYKNLIIKRKAPPHCVCSYANKKLAFISLFLALAFGTQALNFWWKDEIDESCVCHIRIFLEMRTWIDKGNV